MPSTAYPTRFRPPLLFILLLQLLLRLVLGLQPHISRFLRLWLVRPPQSF